MPRSTDPKLDVRFSVPGLAAIRAAAHSIGVKPGTLVRECAERYAATLAREVSEGRTSLAARSSPVRAVAGPPVSQRPAAPAPHEAASQTPTARDGQARAVPASGSERAEFFRIAAARRVR